MIFPSQRREGGRTFASVIDPLLLPLLRCPLSRQTLAPAPRELVDRLETARAAGTLRNRAGQALAEPIDAGLVRADGALFFPVRSGIPVLVAEEAVPLSPP